MANVGTLSATSRDIGEGDAGGGAHQRATALKSGRGSAVTMTAQQWRPIVVESIAPPECARRALANYFGGNTAIASTSNSAPGRASCGTPIVVLASGAALFTYLSRTSR